MAIKGMLYRKLIQGRDFKTPLKRVGSSIEDEMRFIGSRQRVKIPKIRARKKKRRRMGIPRYDISIMEVMR